MLPYTRKRSTEKQPALKALLTEPAEIKIRRMDPIIFYCDVIGMNIDNPHTMNRYLMQELKDKNGFIDRTNFTHHPLLDRDVLLSNDRPIEFRRFTDGHIVDRDSVIIIGLMGGWHRGKLETITNWLNEPHRRWVLNDPNCQIILDYCQEGFTDYIFPDIWQWVRDHYLEDRVIYVSGAFNVDQQYRNWCDWNKVQTNFTCAWYGFFADWMAKRITSDPDLQDLVVEYVPGEKRIMCLNRRPHEHRLLLATMLNQAKIIDRLAISFPKNFKEDSNYMTRRYKDLNPLWAKLADMFHGRIDFLNSSFYELDNTVLPLIADTEDFATNHAHDFNVAFYSKFPVNVITETLFFTRGVFPSEKVWKPMCQGQIFLIAGSANFLNSLRQMGFKTFSPWIDESYDQIDDDLERMVAIVAEINRLVKLPEEEFLSILDNCKQTILHNQNLILNSIEVNKLIGYQIRTILNQI